uniref:HP domain-containing protein n=1 Tax=Macrostomum lignano TaxID=282301 RepID=A0A1I8FPC8_9PLAT
FYDMHSTPPVIPSLAGHAPHPTVAIRGAAGAPTPHQPASPSVTFRLPSIGSGQQQPPPHLRGSPDLAAAASAIYDRHGYSPRARRETRQASGKYPLPSKSLRLYVGPPLRPAEQPAGAAASLPAAAAAATFSGASYGGRCAAAAGCSLRAKPGGDFPARGLPPTALSTSMHQQPRLRREATLVSRGDEAERLRVSSVIRAHSPREFTVHVTAPSNWLRMKWGPKQLRQDLRAGDQRPSYLYTKQAFGQQHGY